MTLRSPMIWLVLFAAGTAQADDLTFRRHDVDLTSTFPACAAIDVNQDGRLDIVSGGWWYEAPGWERHFLRDVQEIRGRYDDYSNLPLDVNGDGRIDLISANYRSESIFWIENTGPDVEWVTHKVTAPGNMETGRLFDVDGDGRLDLLPAGTKFSAWWSIDPDGTWTRHELLPQLIGHGIGFGDIDGDGRGDVVGVEGWAQAPDDRRSGRWEWQPEFELHHDASVPVLVNDVDQDGDADIIWGRGHRTGLYWLEQGADEDQRTWQQHAIDTEWSQFHSLMLADLDGDGREEVVAGKRYLGHDGKDLGEFDPMIVAAYQFDPSARTWRRSILDSESRAGFDLDPKAVDLDADGDIDLICPTRGGLCWLENLGTRVPANDSLHQSIPSTQADIDHTNLSTFRDQNGETRTVQTPDDWGLRRADILFNMQRVMGPLPGPELRVPLDVRQIGDDVETAKYVRRKVTFATTPGERAVAWLLLPRDQETNGRAMLCLHQTTPLGKDEPVGLGGDPHLYYAQELAERGFVCLVPDYPSFGEDHTDFADNADDSRSGTMQAIWNNIRAIDLLESLPEVDPDRLGIIGHSLGGHNALFTAAFDQRLAAVVTSCGFTNFRSYQDGDLSGWTSPRYMPRIASEFGNDPARVPFDFHEVLGAIAPRPVFVNAPLQDENFAHQGVVGVVKAVEPVYERMRSRDSQTITLESPDAGHDFPDDMRFRVYDWLKQVLK